VEFWLEEESGLEYELLTEGTERTGVGKERWHTKNYYYYYYHYYYYY
jgi:hypothetical protein